VQLKESVGREPPFGEYLSADIKEAQMLKAITRERLMKTQQAGKVLACAVVNAEYGYSDGAVITYNSELCVGVVNKSNIQSKPRL
jgi:hypothetical protein